MTRNLREVAGTFEADNLIVNNDFRIQTSGVSLKSGQGVLKRGSVLGKDTDGKYVLADKSKSVVATCILADDTDTTEEVNAVVYITGAFNSNKLIFGGTDTVEMHSDTLSSKGIYLKLALN